MKKQLVKAIRTKQRVKHYITYIYNITILLKYVTIPCPLSSYRAFSCLAILGPSFSLPTFQRPPCQQFC